MIVDNRKSMDFFRPVRSTDPLVERPKAKPAPTVIRREKITSLPPALKASPNAEKERDIYNTAKPPVYSPSVIIEESVVSSKNVTYFEEAEPAPVKQRPATPISRSPKRQEPQRASKEIEEESEFELEDDWLESLKSEGFITDTDDVDGEEKIKDEPLKLGKNAPKKSKYSFLDNSSILKSVKVEKRPLSHSSKIPTPAPKPIPEKKPKPTRSAKPQKRAYIDGENRPNSKKGLPFWATILITVILGIAAGVAVFVLIS